MTTRTRTLHAPALLVSAVWCAFCGCSAGNTPVDAGTSEHPDVQVQYYVRAAGVPEDEREKVQIDVDGTSLAIGEVTLDSDPPTAGVLYEVMMPWSPRLPGRAITVEVSFEGDVVASSVHENEITCSGTEMPPAEANATVRAILFGDELVLTAESEWVLAPGCGICYDAAGDSFGRWCH